MIKLKDNDIQSCNIDIFGSWIEDDIKPTCYPYKHCIISNFLKDDIYEKILNKFPEKPDEHFHEYNNPLEVKYALDDFNHIHPEINNLFYSLSHTNIQKKFETIFNIENLEYDPLMNGAGLHIHPRYGKLNIHLDYEKHPLLDKQRRLNVIYYINDVWKNEWGGDTQLWDSDMKNCVVKSYPKKNTAIIFETSDLSWHGVPDKIMCPENVCRKTLAYYYISPIDPEIYQKNNKIGVNTTGYRTKACFVKRPSDKYDERMEKLYKIRPNRRITKKDMEEIYPEWSKEM